MTMNMLTSAMALSDCDLLARLPQLAADERKNTAELVAHLAALELREDAYAALGYGSLFAYCTRVLRLSEDAACTRTAVLATCRRFPKVLDLLASGALNLTAVRRLGPHLTPGNADTLLARAVNQPRSEIERLVAELSPQPDVPATVRKLPGSSSGRAPAPPVATPPQALLAITPEPPAPAANAASLPAAPPSVLPPPPRHPTVEASAPQRYRIQFTIDKAAHERLRRLQALLRRELPSGDVGVIFERALALLLEKVEKAKLGAGSKPRRKPVIRFETDDRRSDAAAGRRHIPMTVRKAVWARDGGRCAFVAPDGTRCPERAYLEFHHIQPYALAGPATRDNIALRCRRHNQHEGRLVFGRHGTSTAGESHAAYDTGRSSKACRSSTGAPTAPSRGRGPACWSSSGGTRTIGGRSTSSRSRKDPISAAQTWSST